MPLPFFPDWWASNAQVFLDQLSEPSFDAWLLFRYCWQALLCSIPLMLADLVLGLGVLKLFRVRLARSLHAATALGLGMGLSGMGIFIFGLLGRITTKGLFIFLILQLLFGVLLARPQLVRPRFQDLRKAMLLLVCLLPLLAVSLPDLMMPVLDYDSTMYHMASAKHYKSTGRITYHEGIRFNAQPHLTVMLYLRQWWISNDANLTKFVNLEYWAILFLCFQWMARRFRLPGGQWIAICFVLGSPIFSYISRVEYADLGLATWLVLGYCILIRSPRNIFLAGILLGFCAATKLQGMVVVGCFCGAWLLVAGLRNRRFAPVAAPALHLGLGIILVGLPWWMRSFLATGSPVFPFLTNSPDVQNLFAVNVNYGVGRDWLSFLMTPWNMIVVPQERYADLFRFGPACLLLIVVACLALLFRLRQRLDPGTWIGLLGSLAFTVLWFRSGQVMRYEACLLPVWAYLFLASWRRLRIPSWGPLLLVLPVMVWSVLMTSNLVRFGMPPPVSWPATQGTLRNVLPYYRASLALGPHVRPSDKVYLWFCDDARFYFPGRTYGDWFGAYTYTWLGDVRTAHPIQDLPSLLRRLKDNGFQFFVVDRERARTMATIYGAGILQSGLVQPFVPVPNVETIYDDTRYAVFRLL